ncbi:O-phosphoseryl-tRNA(Sec) selenium transferase [Sabethes cyaneus]|uniref:O-phosphoseryl-tRNA(Sec) selenium transferase n=1 Tax=Sabethes cyaneus TaxID=53552 RepID=UPI00237D80FB|nr:O-phosphoseryl-tRNA(Sec) selenium transferase [Sabethes cyaneus]
MNEFTLKTIAPDLVPANYLSVANGARVHRDKQIKTLLEKKKLPENGWDNASIEYFISELSLMDSNNFIKPCGIGEREGRIISELVRRRHYNFAHGIGRSGNLTEPQPKAAGSTLMSNLTNCLLLDLIREMGIKSCKVAILIPLATGMTAMLTLLSLKTNRPESRYVLWSRIDQKSCLKSITTAGLTPVVIDTVPRHENGHDIFGTNVSEFRSKVEELGASNICCVLSTTSCFAPRTCDNIIELAQLCKEHDIPHIVNNAYGLQSTYLTHQIEQAGRLGRVDAFIQSTDKNLLVPVGGAIIAGFEKAFLDQISASYPGRASGSQTIDVLITLLSLGKNGYLKLTAERKELHRYLSEQLHQIAVHYGESLVFGKNPISMALTLNHFKSNVDMLGAMLHLKGVTGCRVVNSKDCKTIVGRTFQAWGAHSDLASEPYLTASAAIGISRQEIDTFLRKLRNIFGDLKKADEATITTDVLDKEKKN